MRAGGQWAGLLLLGCEGARETHTFTALHVATPTKSCEHPRLGACHPFNKQLITNTEPAGDEDDCPCKQA